MTGRAIELDGMGWVVPKDETVVVMTTRTRSAIVQAQPAARLEWFAMAMVDMMVEALLIPLDLSLNRPHTREPRDARAITQGEYCT